MTPDRGAAFGARIRAAGETHTHALDETLRLSNRIAMRLATLATRSSRMAMPLTTLQGFQIA